MSFVGVIAALAVTGWVQSADKTAATADVEVMRLIDRARTVTIQDDQQCFGPLRFAQMNSVVVIRSAAELLKHSTKSDQPSAADIQQQLSKELAKLFQVDAIDWDKQMVVGVIGDRGGQELRPEVVAVSLTANTAGAAEYHFLVIPAYGQRGNVHKGLALIDRTDGRVKLRPPAMALTGQARIVTFSSSEKRVYDAHKKGGFVLRSAADLVAHSVKLDQASDAAVQQAMTRELARLFQVDSIDWSKQMVVGVRGNLRRFERGHLEFLSLWVQDNTVTVRWRELYAKEKNPLEGTGSPMGLALVPRVNGEVKFEEHMGVVR